MAALTWASPSNALRSRWFWASIAILICTVIIVRTTATAEIVSRYTPNGPIWGISHDLPGTSEDIPDNGEDGTNASEDPLETNDGSSPSGGSLYHVKNSTLGFQKVFAISLPSRTDQHDTLTLTGRLLDIDIEIMPGVNGSQMDPKAVPLSKELRKKPFQNGAMGAWRAHVNVLQKIVRENIQTALIMEGDADWDIRFKDQLVQFAKASRILIQNGKNSDYSIDPTAPESRPNDVSTEFSLNDYDRVQHSTTSPYGDTDKWDVLWLGHCAAHFTEPQERVALGRVVISDDLTVPQPRWLDLMFGAQDLKTSYPAHTRIVHQTTGNVCTFGYAVTQKAARAMLYECGVKLVDSAMDIMLNNMCGGNNDRSRLRCMTAQPSYFYQHIKPGLISDINQQSVDEEAEEGKKPFTHNIRLSSRMNLQQMIFGWENYTEQWRDDEPGEVKT